MKIIEKLKYKYKWWRLIRRSKRLALELEYNSKGALNVVYRATMAGKALRQSLIGYFNEFGYDCWPTNEELIKLVILSMERYNEKVC